MESERITTKVIKRVIKRPTRFRGLYEKVTEDITITIEGIRKNNSCRSSETIEEQYEDKEEENCIEGEIEEEIENYNLRDSEQGNSIETKIEEKEDLYIKNEKEGDIDPEEIESIEGRIENLNLTNEEERNIDPEEKKYTENIDPKDEEEIDEVIVSVDLNDGEGWVPKREESVRDTKENPEHKESLINFKEIYNKKSHIEREYDKDEISDYIEKDGFIIMELGYEGDRRVIGFPEEEYIRIFGKSIQECRKYDSLKHSKNCDEEGLLSFIFNKENYGNITVLISGISIFEDKNFLQEINYRDQKKSKDVSKDEKTKECKKKLRDLFTLIKKSVNIFERSETIYVQKMRFLLEFEEEILNSLLKEIEYKIEGKKERTKTDKIYLGLCIVLDLDGGIQFCIKFGRSEEEECARKGEQSKHAANVCYIQIYEYRIEESYEEIISIARDIKKEYDRKIKNEDYEWRMELMSYLENVFDMKFKNEEEVDEVLENGIKGLEAMGEEKFEKEREKMDEEIKNDNEKAKNNENEEYVCIFVKSKHFEEKNKLLTEYLENILEEIFDKYFYGERLEGTKEYSIVKDTKQVFNLLEDVNDEKLDNNEEIEKYKKLKVEKYIIREVAREYIEKKGKNIEIDEEKKDKYKTRKGKANKREKDIKKQIRDLEAEDEVETSEEVEDEVRILQEVEDEAETSEEDEAGTSEEVEDKLGILQEVEDEAGTSEEVEDEEETSDEYIKKLKEIKEIKDFKDRLKKMQEDLEDYCEESCVVKKGYITIDVKYNYRRYWGEEEVERIIEELKKNNPEKLEEEILNKRWSMKKINK